MRILKNINNSILYSEIGGSVYSQKLQNRRFCVVLKILLIVFCCCCCCLHFKWHTYSVLATAWHSFCSFFPIIRLVELKSSKVNIH